MTQYIVRRVGLAALTVVIVLLFAFSIIRLIPGDVVQLMVAEQGYAADVEALRRQPGAVGMVSSMGWYFTKHAAGVYSARPPVRPYRPYDPKEDVARVEAQERPPLVEEAEGPGVVETYTIVYNCEGQLEQGIVIGRMEQDSGGRFLAHTEPDQEAFDLMAGSEFVGRRGRVRHDRQQRRNLFYPD
jgi:acetyl-CoA C-acetyltransferase